MKCLLKNWAYLSNEYTEYIGEAGVAAIYRAVYAHLVYDCQHSCYSKKMGKDTKGLKTRISVERRLQVRFMKNGLLWSIICRKGEQSQTILPDQNDDVAEGIRELFGKIRFSREKKERIYQRLKDYDLKK